jgi:hypothetical protein
VTDVSNLDDLANAIATSSAKIRNYAKAQAAATQSQEVDIQSRAKASAVASIAADLDADIAALEARVAALEVPAPPPPPPPPPVGTLKWKPPGYPNYSGYTVWSPTNADARRSFTATTDVLVKMPSTPITVDGGVLVQNARNVVIIGGEIFDSNVLTQAQASANELWRQIGLYLVGITGTVHLEGLWIHGNGVGDAIQSGTGNSNATIRIQNCRLHNNHDVQNSSTTGWDGAHPDTFQCYAGPAYWHCFQNTLISSGNLRTWQPYEYGANIQGVHWERMNMLAQQKPGSYVITDDAQSWWPEYHADLWLSYGGSGNFHRVIVGSGANYTTPHASWDPGGVFNVSGEPIKYGVRPEGDWVPTSMVAAGTYVSPGYQ